jgi:HSP20 family protein
MTFGYRDSFESLQRELEQMLATAFGSPGGAVTGVYPPVDVFDAGEEYLVTAELPGLKKDDVHIEVEDDTLTLRGERKLPEVGDNAAWHRRERPAGRFRRVVRLGRLDSETARAEFKDGVLTVRLPKAKETRPRRVEIQVG